MVSQPKLDERLRDLEQELGEDDLFEACLALVLRRGDEVEVVERVAANWSAQESQLLDLAASLAAHHPALEGDEPRLRSWLEFIALQSDLIRQLGGEPRRVLDEVGQTVATQARLQGEARRTIWQEPMLEPRDAAVALGARETNREKIRQYRERSWLLGLPSGRGYVYPTFQFDPRRRDVFPEVRTVNECLKAVDDPWGVASWWIFRHARLDARPVDLVGTERAADLTTVAQAVTELVG